MRYPVVLHSDDDVSYGVTVPDIEGCFSAGDTFDEALVEAEEAINAHLEALAEAGEDIPEAQDFATHRQNPDYADGVWASVEVDVSPFLGKAERLNVTLPHNVLARIDAEVSAHRERYSSRSNFLMQAAVELLSASRGVRFVRYHRRPAKKTASAGVKLQKKWRVDPVVPEKKTV